jgi:hypothetical protein
VSLVDAAVELGIRRALTSVFFVDAPVEPRVRRACKSVLFAELASFFVPSTRITGDFLGFVGFLAFGVSSFSAEASSPFSLFFFAFFSIDFAPEHLLAPSNTPSYAAVTHWNWVLYFLPFLEQAMNVSKQRGSSSTSKLVSMIQVLGAVWMNWDLGLQQTRWHLYHFALVFLDY